MNRKWKRKWIPLLLDPGYNINAIMQNSTLPLLCMTKKSGREGVPETS
ncbi:hypothetical protein T03_14416 [Trichinella britovi]|uniref:Uncharacterized protein n=1 Tax=Trichinella britovi TaxID=45882 RepID=A0A0V1AJK9_TRIBR|nr:hypothetical protein T03_13341 [Trichinella britovi]KRY25726.1 hypothetical protein T03_14416 [Trichinella britovi]